MCLERIDRRFGRRLYWRCSRCRLTFLAPECVLDPGAEKTRYDLHQNGPDDAGYVRFLRQLAEPLAARLRPGSLGLDYGCGPGPTLCAILEAMGHSVENYDPYYRPDPSVLRRQYDFVTCSEVMEHVRDPRRTFLRLDRLLKDGGCLAVMTGILENEDRFVDWWYHLDPTHIAFYQRRTFEWIAGWLGWRVEFPGKNVILCSKPAAGEPMTRFARRSRLC
ncbi:MAG: class I SAM-dependent methyltransferase [Acidobacteriota bacterium]